MPIECLCKPDDSLVIFTHIGLVSDEEFLERYIACFNDPDFDSSFDLLVDLRQTNSSARSTAVLSKLAEFMGQKYMGAKTSPKAAVLAPERLSFGLARIFEVFSEDVNIDFKVFREADEATEWLGVAENLLD